VATRARDYYEVLGVSKQASDKDIRAAYRKLARQYHPDLNPGNKAAEARFKEIQQAYEVLGNPESRKKYDQFGHAWEYAGQGPSTGGFRPGSGQWRTTETPFDFGDLGAEGFDLSDVLGRVFGGFGGSRTQTRARRGRDVEQPVTITLEEAYGGTTRLIEVLGENGEPRRLEVKIPAGVRDGSRVRVAGEGGPGLGGGPRGDLYLVIGVRPHQTFERKGDDLHLDVPVPLTMAALGGEVQVPTLKGRLALRIPPETQNGRVIRLAGQGMPRLGGDGHGDMFAKVRVVLPSSLSPRERELFEELRRLRPGT